MKNLQLLASVVAMLLMLSGCEKAKVTNEATADVFVNAMTNASGVTVYTAKHSVFSYNKMTSVSVKTPDDKTFALTNYENGGYSFYNKPIEADYSALAPTTGSYVYTVQFNDGEIKTYSNSITAATLQPAVITSLVKSADEDSVYLSWNAIPSTDAYQLIVKRGTARIYNPLPFEDGSYPLKANLRIGMPISNLTNGVTGTYTFELIGLLYESTVSFYLLANSTSTRDIAL